MNIDWDTGNFVLTSVTGFREQESNLPSTYTGEVGDINGIVSIFGPAHVACRGSGAAADINRGRRGVAAQSFCCCALGTCPTQ